VRVAEVASGETDAAYVPPWAYIDPVHRWSLVYMLVAEYLPIVFAILQAPTTIFLRVLNWLPFVSLPFVFIWWVFATLCG
jgi:hypothetical protein